MMLAIAVQLRAKRIFGIGITEGAPRLLERVFGGILAYVAVVAMGVGEIVSIAALYYNSGRGGKGPYVFIALFIGTVLLFYGTTDGVFQQLRTPDEAADGVDGRTEQETQTEVPPPQGTTAPSSEFSPASDEEGF